ncbi:thioesterase domain-containing protein [Plantactinospora sp. KBS50]|uniref:thioesterase domain-containing protein n=1 Tax=Plantactinospora sp. KBS50 TaxID=2024580 RepID=UPI000BAB1B8D|nr:thioesterase domain-containing protein [Plantactinospora sp. KBS50]ASW55625.1 hypothetical protein CIK06_17725 [Plantactinospora sp. KBS50]
MLTDSQRSALAARLRNGRRPAAPAAANPVVPLGRAGLPAFALHPVSGSVHEYAALARELDGTVALSGIEAAGLRPGTTPCADLAALAARYAELIRAADPGPYRLVGWSMGGVLAYETALRLVAGGGQVALIVLVDAPYLTVPRYADSAAGLAALFVADALRGVGLEPDAAADLPVAAQLDRLAARLAPEPDDRAMLAAELGRRHEVFAAHTTALAGYRPGTGLDAPAVLVRAGGSLDSIPNWSRMLRPGARTLTVTGGHYDCLRPPAVGAVAAAITAAVTPGSAA